MAAEALHQPQNRQRAFKPKSKNGCAICRKRRIKCDEQRPSCFRCSRSGWKCDFLDAPPTPRTRSPSSSSSSSPEHLPPPALLPVCILDTPRQRRSYDFFINRTIPQLVGSFSLAEPTDEFWETLLLRTVNHEPAIKHAVIALGALHEAFALDEFECGVKEFALVQYTKAISSLLESGQEGKGVDVDVALITCVLFVCFEILRGHHGSALSHIDAGSKIVREHQGTSRAAQPRYGSDLTKFRTPYVPMSILHIIFSRLDTQASQIAVSRPRRLLDPFLPSTSKPMAPAKSPFNIVVPQRFESLAEAYDFFAAICTSLAHSLDACVHPHSTLLELAPFSATTILNLSLLSSAGVLRMNLWHQAFAHFNASNCDEEAFRLLRLKATLAQICFGIDHSRMEDETQWDRYHEEFKSMLDDGEFILNLGPQKDKRVFTLDNSALFFIFFLAAKCRIPDLRRRAIALLTGIERQEGIWNSLLMARVAERIIELEETAIEEGKESMRITWVNVNFGLGERKAELMFIQGAGVLFGKAWAPAAKEILQW